MKHCKRTGWRWDRTDEDSQATKVNSNLQDNNTKQCEKSTHKRDDTRRPRNTATQNCQKKNWAEWQGRRCGTPFDIRANKLGLHIPTLFLWNCFVGELHSWLHRTGFAELFFGCPRALFTILSGPLFFAYKSKRSQLVKKCTGAVAQFLSHVSKILGE